MATTRTSHQTIQEIRGSSAQIRNPAKIYRRPETPADVHYSSHKPKEFRDPRTDYHLRQCIQSSAAFFGGGQGEPPWQ